MSSNTCAAALAVPLAAATFAVAAQQAEPSRRPASAPAPAVVFPTYGSALEGYRPFKDQPVTSWKASNDLVGRIGGWQAYAREAQGQAPAASAAARPSAMPASRPASGNVGHGKP